MLRVSKLKYLKVGLSAHCRGLRRVCSATISTLAIIVYSPVSGGWWAVRARRTNFATAHSLTKHLIDVVLLSCRSDTNIDTVEALPWKLVVLKTVCKKTTRLKIPHKFDFKVYSTPFKFIWLFNHSRISEGAVIYSVSITSLNLGKCPTPVPMSRVLPVLLRSIAETGR